MSDQDQGTPEERPTLPNILALNLPKAGLKLPMQDSNLSDTTSYRANMRALEDRREEAILQVVLTAEAVAEDADHPMHHQATHYLVEKDMMEALMAALRTYKNANEDFIGAYSGTDATPSTKVL